MRFWLPALVTIAVLPAAAHHPFRAYYDAARPGAVTGVVAELRMINPHVVLIVDGTGPDGRTGRWAFEGLPPNAFRYRGVTDLRERLTPGTRLTISGWPATDPDVRAFSGNEITFADGSTIPFGSAPPQEGEGWICESPCGYTYPDAGPQ